GSCRPEALRTFRPTRIPRSRYARPQATRSRPEQRARRCLASKRSLVVEGPLCRRSRWAPRTHEHRRAVGARTRCRRWRCRSSRGSVLGRRWFGEKLVECRTEPRQRQSKADRIGCEIAKFGNARDHRSFNAVERFAAAFGEAQRDRTLIAADTSATDQAALAQRLDGRAHSWLAKSELAANPRRAFVARADRGEHADGREAQLARRALEQAGKSCQCSNGLDRDGGAVDGGVFCGGVRGGVRRR